MRKTFILTVAVIMALSVLTGWSFAGENSAKISAEAAKTVEVPKEEEAAEEAKKTIVARVNGVEINMFMLVRAMNRVAPKYLKEGEVASLETTEKIKEEALDRLIFEELAVQEATRQGINPTSEAIDKVVAQVRESVGTEEAYREYLNNAGLTEDSLRKMIERSRRYELITASEIYGKVRVDEKLLRDEYEKEKSRYVLPDDYVVEDVFFLNKEEASRKRAVEVLGQLKKYGDNVWKLVLDGTFIVRKIKITKERNPGIYEAMAEMKVGSLSAIIKDSDGLHIIKILRKDPSRQATFEEVRATIEPKFLVSAQEQRKKEWEKELRKDAKIEVLPER